MQNSPNVKVGSTIKFRDFYGENTVWQGTVEALGNTVIVVKTQNGEVFNFVTRDQIVQILN